MSMHIALTRDDYKHIMSWFELAFGKKSHGPSDSDQTTFRKISVMGLECCRKELLED